MTAGVRSAMRLLGFVAVLLAVAWLAFHLR